MNNLLINCDARKEKKEKRELVMALDPNKDVLTNLFQSAQKAVPSQALEVNSQGASVKANTTSQ